MRLSRLGHMMRRRKALRQEIDASAAFEIWEETCVPSYCHPNLAAAWVSWRRLFAAIDLAEDTTEWGPVLDFGASVGELAHLVPEATQHYDWIEQLEPAAHFLQNAHPGTRRQTLEDAPEDRYRCVFALDSLEHNDDYPRLVEILLSKLDPTGVLIVSGPTENALYRLGRRIAGFEGHYHKTNIHAIERAIAEQASCIAYRTVPAPVSLFRLSAWRIPQSD